MKLGIISDIHASLEALEKALVILQREGVDNIVCAGDLVERGKEGDAVVALIQSRQIPCVLGNHDESALRKHAPENLKPEITLASDTIDYLGTLPFLWRFEWEHWRILLLHSTLESNREYLYIHSPTRKFKLMAREAAADIIIHGHTHEPSHAKFMGVHFFNPGSVYQGYARSSHTCATLTLPKLDFQVFHIETGALVEDVPYVR